MTPAAATTGFPANTRFALTLLWLAGLLIAGWAISQRLELSGDLRKFMPAQAEPEAGTNEQAARAAWESEVVAWFA